ncbi:MAG: phosphoribosyl-ATP diphosphatase [Spirochaetaceae bacterium]|nr:MAG: phosphoribosyl-ATP diphosphatase [Spirochaetaceae bacterium]
MTEDSAEQTAFRTVHILNEHGESIGTAAMNGKAFRKSLEQGELWTYHEQTGRVLPPAGGLSILSMSEDGDDVRVVLSEADARRFRSNPTAEEPAEAAGSQGIGSDASGIETAPTSTPESLSDELAHLQQTVSDRREHPAEGSYTSYLFEQGRAKIRKKVGEEGIEVCLSESPDELVSESADLMFHLAVLLEYEGKSFADVADELRRRRLKG